MTDKYTLYAKLIQKYGCEAQIIVAIEELAELQKELTKWLRGKGNIQNIAEEITDVRIMTEQLEYIFVCTDEIVKTWFEKIERIKDLVSEERKEL